nr:glycosyltransferase family 4 protein [Motilibacter aurantiacus]
MRLIPNAASDEEFAEAPARTGRPDGGRLVLCVANHLPDKGHDAVLDAFRRSAGPRDRLVIVGNRSPQRSELGEWARCRWAALRDRRVTLAEGVPRAEVVQLYKDADVFLFGSRIECAPLVLIEAMAAGLPFVTTSAGNARDYADAGIVTDEAGLADGLRTLLADPALRGRLGARGRERWTQQHRWSDVVDAYAALFEEVVDGRAAAASAGPVVPGPR